MRQQDRRLRWLLLPVFGSLAGVTGVILAAVVLWLERASPGRIAAPHRSIAVFSAADVLHVVWLDQRRVVLRSPWRVFYRDEMLPRDFCRLRRLCRGLPD